MTLSKFLRDARHKAKLTIYDVAKRARISPSHISRIESGSARVPSNDLLLKLASILEVDIDTLFSSAKRIAPDLYTWLAQHPDVVDELRARKKANDVLARSRKTS